MTFSSGRLVEHVGTQTNKMNLFRSRLSFRKLFGLRCIRITEAWNLRGMCNKPHEVKTDSPAAAPAQISPRLGFKIPGYRPSELDKKMLLWSGRYKTADQIPDLVSFEVLDAARNKVRVKACYMMMAATVGACLLMIFLGKRAASRNESLTGQNMERKAKWKEELQREQEGTIPLPDKPQ
ncbi:protein FAM162B isoform X2 [Syngnathoides biaculeatus]|uniref:protein FAM162B isoform X2 n=1 Tax=Syngnathoides biaculeatus TaxID=300417 RepID=UPI002ADE1DA8|nr:protein FAM162B isoform X2 [Syngnathoides biaculeatus]